MTIKTNDGIVVAADSRVTSTNDGKTRILSEYGEKVIQVGSHTAVTFAGAATLVSDQGVTRSIGSIVGTYKSSHRVFDSTYVSPKKVSEVCRFSIKWTE
jgi:20S proteasome alpha/beta subunit